MTLADDIQFIKFLVGFSMAITVVMGLGLSFKIGRLMKKMDEIYKVLKMKE